MFVALFDHFDKTAGHERFKLDGGKFVIEEIGLVFSFVEKVKRLF